MDRCMRHIGGGMILVSDRLYESASSRLTEGKGVPVLQYRGIFPGQE